MDERKRRKGAPSPTGEWRLDPNEVRLQKRRLKEAQKVGALGGLARYGIAALAIAGAVGVYLNWETLRGATLNVAALRGLVDGAAPGTDTGPAGLETDVVEGAGVVGDALPTSLGSEPPPEETVAVAAPPPATAPAAEPVNPAAPAVNVAGGDAANDSPAPSDAPEPTAAAPEPEPEPVAAAPEPPPPPRPPEPELPVTPEVFDFGIDTMSASEADASVRLLILRNGGRRGVSSVTWWTVDGTARGGTDYASLGPQTVRFAAGEQNRSIQIPIVGDRNPEGPETFVVHLAAGESASESTSQIEVIINDDD
jgi:hypothetical protein